MNFCPNFVYELLECFSKNYVMDNGHSKAMKKVIFDISTCAKGKKMLVDET